MLLRLDCTGSNFEDDNFFIVCDNYNNYWCKRQFGNSFTTSFSQLRNRFARSQNRHSILESVGPLAMLVYQLLKVIEARLQYFMSVWFLITCSCGRGQHNASFFPLYKFRLIYWKKMLNFLSICSSDPPILREFLFLLHCSQFLLWLKRNFNSLSLYSVRHNLLKLKQSLGGPQGLWDCRATLTLN